MKHRSSFAANADDWSWWNGLVVPRLRALHSAGYRLVVFRRVVYVHVLVVSCAAPRVATRLALDAALPACLACALCARAATRAASRTRWMARRRPARRATSTMRSETCAAHARRRAHCALTRVAAPPPLRSWTCRLPRSSRRRTTRTAKTSAACGTRLCRSTTAVLSQACTPLLCPLPFRDASRHPMVCDLRRDMFLFAQRWLTASTSATRRGGSTTTQPSTSCSPSAWG